MALSLALTLTLSPIVPFLLLSRSVLGLLVVPAFLTSLFVLTGLLALLALLG